MHRSKKGKGCFIISPIGRPDSELRKRFDKTFQYIILPAVKKYGFKPLRADQIAEPGIITSQIVKHLTEAKLVVADLTGANGNVMYELAIRHGAMKPVIQIIQAGEPIPFDIAGMRTIEYDLQDIESVERAKALIQEQIKAIVMRKVDYYNPIAQTMVNQKKYSRLMVNKRIPKS